MTATSLALPILGAEAFDSSQQDGPDTRPVTKEHRKGCLISEPWTVVGISADGRRLLVHTGGDSGLLDRYAGSAVRESADRVEVGTYLIKLNHGDGSGVSAVAFLAVSIKLERPLGSRALVHAPVTKDC